MSFSTEVKQKLFTLIDEMDSYHWLFTKNPGKDFHPIVSYMVSLFLYTHTTPPKTWRFPGPLY